MWHRLTLFAPHLMYPFYYRFVSFIGKRYFSWMVEDCMKDGTDSVPSPSVLYFPNWEGGNQGCINDGMCLMLFHWTQFVDCLILSKLSHQHFAALSTSQATPHPTCWRTRTRGCLKICKIAVKGSTGGILRPVWDLQLQPITDRTNGMPTIPQTIASKTVLETPLVGDLLKDLG